MKTYKGNNQNEAAKNDKALKVKYAVFVGVAALIIATAITLAVVFTRNAGMVDLPVDVPGVVTPDPDPTDPVVSPVTYYLPIENGTITRESAIDHLVYMPSLNLWKTHEGIDFAATEGTAVLAVTDGTVTDVQETTLEGIVVIITHADGLVSVYKSLSTANVEVGSKVIGGQQIGVAGTMLVELSDGIHLHLEMLVNGDYVDPMTYVDADILK